MKKWGIFIGGILYVLIGMAEVPLTQYPLADKQEEIRFQNLLADLRCLVCQNETLADSTADLANDLRNEVYQQILQHKSNADINAYLVNRYGNFILYRPPVQQNTLILWFGPGLLLLLGIGIVIKIVRQRNQ